VIPENIHTLPWALEKITLACDNEYAVGHAESGYLKMPCKACPDEQFIKQHMENETISLISSLPQHSWMAI